VGRTMGSGPSKKAGDQDRNLRRDLDDFDHDGRQRAKASPGKQPSYYESRGGRRSRLSPTPGGAPGGSPGSVHSFGPSPSPPPLRATSSSYYDYRRRGPSAQARLEERRRHWAKETTKRIHVVVRVRPLNVREIKEQAKVSVERRGGLTRERRGARTLVGTKETNSEGNLLLKMQFPLC